MPCIVRNLTDDEAIIQLVDFAEGGQTPEKEVKRTSTRRSGGRKNQEGEGKATKSRKANSQKSPNEVVSKAEPVKPVKAPRRNRQVVKTSSPA